MTPQEIEQKRVEHVRLISAYKDLFDNPECPSGQIVLADLMKRGHVTTPVIAPTKQQTIVNAAEQAFVLNIMKMSELSPETINQNLIKQHQEYVRSKSIL